MKHDKSQGNACFSPRFAASVRSVSSVVKQFALRATHLNSYEKLKVK